VHTLLIGAITIDSWIVRGAVPQLRGCQGMLRGRGVEISLSLILVDFGAIYLLIKFTYLPYL